MAAPRKSERGRALGIRHRRKLFVEECAEDRGQDFAVMALDVRVEHAGQGQEGLSEIGAILRSL